MAGGSLGAHGSETPHLGGLGSRTGCVTTAQKEAYSLPACHQGKYCMRCQKLATCLNRVKYIRGVVLDAVEIMHAVLVIC